VGWLFLIAGISVVIYATEQLYRYRGSDSWPTTEGTIEGQPELHSYGSAKAYYAVLFYSYSVDGERHSGTWQTPSGSRKQQILGTVGAKLPSGSSIIVRYNPKKPTLSMADIDASIFCAETTTTLGL
jgi:hypothetical protein